MAELRAQTAALTLEKEAYAGRASCTRRAAWHVPCNTYLPRHSAHQHLPCSPSTAVMPARTAGTGGESATSHVPRSHEMEDNIHLSVPRAQRRCAASRGALSAQHSNLAAATSKPTAAFCGAIDASLRDGLGSGSQCTLLRTHACARAPFSHARVSALRECAGCASVSPMWTLRVPHAGHHVVDRTPGWDPMRGARSTA